LRGRAHKLTNPFLLSKFAKELFNRYHGSLLAYDEGLVLGDVELAEALYRCVPPSFLLSIVLLLSRDRGDFGPRTETPSLSIPSPLVPTTV